MRITFLALFFSAYTGILFAQEETNDFIDKKFLDHYVGLQVNELLRQVLNVNSLPLTHPYFLNYAINLHEQGWGINYGIGFDYQNIQDGDAITKVKNLHESYIMRIGPEKKFYLGKRLILATGIDYSFGREFSRSNVRIEQDDEQFSETIIENIVNQQGIGARLSISFSLSKWLLVGSEASYTYMLQKTTQKVDETISFTFQESVNYEEDSFEERAFTFQTPVAIFLTLRF